MGAASRGHVGILNSYISEDGKLAEGVDRVGPGVGSRYGESEEVKESLLVQKIVNEFRNATPGAAIRAAQWLLSRGLITFSPESDNDSNKDKNSENDCSDEQVRRQRALSVLPESLKFLNAQSYFDFLLFVESTGNVVDWEKVLPGLLTNHGLTLAATDYLDNRLHLMDNDTSRSLLFRKTAACAYDYDFSLLKALFKRFPAMSSSPNIAKAIYEALACGVDASYFSSDSTAGDSCDYWGKPPKRSVHERLPDDGSLLDLVLFLDSQNLSPPNDLDIPLTVCYDISHCDSRHKSILTHTLFDFVQLLLDRGVRLSIEMMKTVMSNEENLDRLLAFVERNYARAKSGSEWFFAAMVCHPSQIRTLLDSVLYPKYWQDDFQEKLIRQCLKANVEQWRLEESLKWMKDTLPPLRFKFTNSLISYIARYDVKWFLSMFGVNSEILLRLHELFFVEQYLHIRGYFSKVNQLVQELALTGVVFPRRVIDYFLKNVRRYLRDRSWDADTSDVWETIAFLRARGASWTKDTFCILIKDYYFSTPLMNRGSGGRGGGSGETGLGFAPPNILWKYFVKEKCPFGGKAASKVEEMKGEEERRNAKHYLTKKGLYSVLDVFDCS